MDRITIPGRTLDVRYDQFLDRPPSTIQAAGYGSLMGRLDLFTQYDRLHLVDPKDDRFVLLIVKANPMDRASPWIVQLSRYAAQHGDWPTLANPRHNWLSKHQTAAEAFQALQRLGADA